MRRLLAVAGAVASITVSVLPTVAAAPGEATAPGALSLQVGNHHIAPSLRLLRAHNQLSVSIPPPLPIPMQYHGGAVERSGSTSYAIFWEPVGSVVSATYNSLIQRYFGDVGGSTLYGVATQYYQTVNKQKQYIANASSLGGSWVDTAAYPSATLSDQDIQNEVVRAMAANGWTAGVGREFFVFTAKGENSCMSSNSCSFSTYCAYHGNFTHNGADVLYANQPYTGTDPSGCGAPGSPNGDQDADSTINVISHEQIETVTDPNLDAWYDVIGQEIGDKCNFTFGKQGADGGDITMNGHRYLVQEEWSNKGLKCTLG